PAWPVPPAGASTRPGRAGEGSGGPSRAACAARPGRVRTRPARGASPSRPCAAPTGPPPSAAAARRRSRFDSRELSHGLDDGVVAGAAAKVARKALTDLPRARESALVEQGLRRQQHAGSAEAALQRSMVDERLLETLELR